MRIALLGDVALIGRYDRTVDPNVDARVDIVRRHTKDCDFVVANLESPLTRVKRTLACKGVYLRSDPANVETLVRMGVTHVTLANNHTYDYGRRGVEECVRTLKDAGIRHVGLNGPPEILEKSGDRAMLEGFCCLSANALNYGKKPWQVRTLTPETMESFLTLAEGESYLPIASVHFGLEGLHYPSLEHMALFRNLAERHRYVLHGNHPHAIQGYELRDESLLIYAQGNLCFDETPVTSIHATPKEKPEERKCYVCIVEVEGTRLVSHDVVPLTDLGTGLLHESEDVGEELTRYSELLDRPVPEIQDLRDAELAVQREEAQKRDLRFFLDRLNRRYVGAYLNGRRHAKEYELIMGELKNMGRIQ